MSESLYTSLHIQKRSSRSNQEWQVLSRWNRLPGEWRDLVLPPLRLEVFQDTEIAASRAVGYDEDEAPCFCTHDYAVGETYSVGEDGYHAGVAYAESLSAWRLRDGRWLIHRRIATAGDDIDAQSFYTFSEDMPR